MPCNKRLITGITYIVYGSAVFPRVLRLAEIVVRAPTTLPGPSSCPPTTRRESCCSVPAVSYLPASSLPPARHFRVHTRYIKNTRCEWLLSWKRGDLLERKELLFLIPPFFPSPLLSVTMLTRRLLFTPQCPSSLFRSFTTSVVHCKTPSLADITPNGAPSFDARQKEFRDSVKAARQAKEQQDSQFVKTSKSSSTSSTSPVSSAPDPSATQESTHSSITSDIASKLSLGSLSTHSAEAARDEAYQSENSKRKGALSSLIYGTHEGQQMDKEIEKSFSQVLARGKYVHSIVFHQVKPDKVDEYVKLVGEWYPKMASLEENHVHLVGSWRTEVGDCDTFGI